MFDSIPEPGHRIALAIALIAALWTTGCASTAPHPGDLAPILPAATARLEIAPPAARDALEKGLRWIAEDAPETAVEQQSAVHLAKGGGR